MITSNRPVSENIDNHSDQYEGRLNQDCFAQNKCLILLRKVQEVFLFGTSFSKGIWNKQIQIILNQR
jgi:hypothetical protein